MNTPMRHLYLLIWLASAALPAACLDAQEPGDPHSIVSTRWPAARPLDAGEVDPRGGGNCPGDGGCFDPHGAPGCDDVDCCEAICSFDPFCCDDQWDEICVGEANDFCTGGTGGGCVPSCNKVNVECLVGLPQYARRSSVGQLINDGEATCTVWLVAAPNIVLTNEHCVPNSLNGVQVKFNFECSGCEGGEIKQTDSYNVLGVIHESRNLDYALLRLEGDPAAVWGVAPVDAAAPVAGTPVYEIHHGDGLVKGYDEGQITTLNVPGGCISGTTAEVGITAVATGGASGAPVFNAVNHCVMAICHCGPDCAAGFGVPLSFIWPDALPHILAAGGAVADCFAPPCEGPDGDLNADGLVDGRDVPPFVNALIEGTSLQDVCRGDFDADQALDPGDVPGFVDALLAAP